MELDYNRVVILTRRIPVLRKNQLLKRFQYPVIEPKGLHGEGSEKISTGMALVLWTADFLAAAKVLATPQQDLIIDSELGDRVIEFGNTVGSEYSSGEWISIAHLCVVNRSFAGVTHPEVGDGVAVPKYINLNTGEMVEYYQTFAENPIEVISYNLTALFTTRMKSYNNLQKLKKPDAICEDATN